MKTNKIEQGKQYEITIGKNTIVVRVVEIEHRINGQIVFDCMNVKTNKRTTILPALSKKESNDNRRIKIDLSKRPAFGV